MVAINNNLKSLRQERGLTLRQLSEKVNIDFSALSRVENGTRGINDNDISILTKFFNVSADYLLGLSDERTPPTTKEKLSGVQLALFNQTENLNEEQMKDVLKYIEFLKAKEGL